MTLEDQKEEKRLCFYCQKEKFFIFSGKKLKDGTKIYNDLKGLRWAGKRCPDCERSRVQASMRWDRFERDLIESKLKEAGFEIIKSTPPIKVIKDGKECTVSIRHASVEQNRLMIEPSKDDSQLHVLVFSSVRLCSADQIKSLEAKNANY